MANSDATVGLAKGHHVSGQGEIVMILVRKPSQKVGCPDGLSLPIFQNVLVQTIDAHDADVINQPLLDPFLPHRQATSTTAGGFIKLQQLEVGRSSSLDLGSLLALTSSSSSKARSPYPLSPRLRRFHVAVVSNTKLTKGRQTLVLVSRHITFKWGAFFL